MAYGFRGELKKEGDGKLTRVCYVMERVIGEEGNSWHVWAHTF